MRLTEGLELDLNQPDHSTALVWDEIEPPGADLELEQTQQ